MRRQRGFTRALLFVIAALGARPAAARLGDPPRPDGPAVQGQQQRIIGRADKLHDIYGRLEARWKKGDAHVRRTKDGSFVLRDRAGRVRYRVKSEVRLAAQGPRAELESRNMVLRVKDSAYHLAGSKTRYGERSRWLRGSRVEDTTRASVTTKGGKVFQVSRSDWRRTARGSRWGAKRRVRDVIIRGGKVVQSRWPRHKGPGSRR